MLDQIVAVGQAAGERLQNYGEISGAKGVSTPLAGESASR
jgi:hypothetical protein